MTHPPQASHQPDPPWEALRTLAEAGPALRAQRLFDWPPTVTQCALRLLLSRFAPALPRVVALVGGASSGKSTVFNNLLDGRPVSRIAARGHSTLGLIVAVHADDLGTVEPLLNSGALLQGLSLTPASLDADVAGSPDTITLVDHHLPDLKGILLVDTPDHTSDSAQREGDITLNRLPWFDDLLVVIDQERWFDRQAFGTLNDESTRWGQHRLVLFNRSREESLAPSDREAFAQRARRIGADDLVILEFRQGRGLCRFPPDTLQPVRRWLRIPRETRDRSLRSAVVRAAEHVLNQNDERLRRLVQLRQSAQAALARASPTSRETLAALLTAEERRQLDVVARVLRLRQTSEWFSEQGRRLRMAISSIPGLGILGNRTPPETMSPSSEEAARADLAAAFAQTSIRRAENELRRIHAASAFWNEIRRWTGLEAPVITFPCSDGFLDAIRETAAQFDRAAETWRAKVDSECRGIGMSLQGALGVGAVGLAAVLIAVPGPLAALSWVAAKGAIVGALSHLAVASGAGYLMGKPAGRLVAVIREKLAGSAEFNAVRANAERVHALISLEAGARLTHVLELGQGVVLDPSEPLFRSLAAVHQWGADEHA